MQFALASALAVPSLAHIPSAEYVPLVTVSSHAFSEVTSSSSQSHSDVPTVSPVQQDPPAHSPSCVKVVEEDESHLPPGDSEHATSKLLLLVFTAITAVLAVQAMAPDVFVHMPLAE
jgi:hypothetical protein